jgi:hypothetical protein
MLFQKGANSHKVNENPNIEARIDDILSLNRKLPVTVPKYRFKSKKFTIKPTTTNRIQRGYILASLRLTNILVEKS